MLTAGPGADTVGRAAAAGAEVAAETVTPGIGGFLTFFALAVGLVFLYRSFTAHMRRVDVRARLRREREAEAAAAATADEPEASEPASGSSARRTPGASPGADRVGGP